MAGEHARRLPRRPGPLPACHGPRRRGRPDQPDYFLYLFLDPEGNRRTVAYDRLLLAAGSVNRRLPIPGVAEHAHGFRSVAEALWLRDHLVRQLELAATCEDPAERAARAALRARGESAWRIEQILGSAEAFAAGEVAQVTDMVARLTGRPPRTFVEFAHDLVAAA
jgi:hypothetical protein